MAENHRMIQLERSLRETVSKAIADGADRGLVEQMLHEMMVDVRHRRLPETKD